MGHAVIFFIFAVFELVAPSVVAGICAAKLSKRPWLGWVVGLGVLLLITILLLVP